MRYLAPEITRFFAEETKMAFIASPRQVGKTTLAKLLLTEVRMEAFYFNWDIESHPFLIDTPFSLEYTRIEPKAFRKLPLFRQEINCSRKKIWVRPLHR
jgi:predicted AAA+ superfamily ATPase